MNEIDNRKVIGMNIELLKFLRLYGVEDKRPGWILAFVSLMNNILQLMDIIYNYKNKTIDGLVIQAFLWACLFNIYHRFIVFLVKHKEVDTVMKFINELWDNTEFNRSQRENDILRNSISLGSKIIIFNLSTVFFSIVMAGCYPLIINARETPCEWFFPGIDFHESPLYDVVYLLQASYIVPCAAALNASYSNLVLTWLTFGLVAIRLLKENIRVIPLKETEEDRIVALHDCIKFHNRIIDYINVIKGIISPVSFLEIALLSLMLCFLMFYALYVSFLNKI